MVEAGSTEIGSTELGSTEAGDDRSARERNATGEVAPSLVWARIEAAREALESWNDALEVYPRFRRVKSRVEHEHGTVSVAAAASAAALSEAGFSRSFHELIGVAYRDWRRVSMVSRALALVEDESRSMRQVARDAGFGSVRSFQRAFLRVVGVSPRRHRKLLRAARRKPVSGARDPKFLSPD